MHGVGRCPGESIAIKGPRHDIRGDFSGSTAKLEAYKAQKGWSIEWVSSFGSDFNYDFHVTLDPKVAPVEYNYRNEAETEAKKGHPVVLEGEHHGLSVFFRVGDDVFHTYSVYARGCESLPNAYRLLDATPYGRQQGFEDSPQGGLRNRRTHRGCVHFFHEMR
jgi:predicted dithiol-disulfide oxidoreductase (DUF899 family)